MTEPNGLETLIALHILIEALRLNEAGEDEQEVRPGERPARHEAAGRVL